MASSSSSSAVGDDLVFAINNTIHKKTLTEDILDATEIGGG